MSDAPERIWATVDEDDQGIFIECLGAVKYDCPDEVGYVRADLHDTIAAELAAVKAELAAQDIAALKAQPERADDLVTIPVTRRLLAELDQWAEDEAAHWPVETMYQDHLNRFRAAIRRAISEDPK